MPFLAASSVVDAQEKHVLRSRGRDRPVANLPGTEGWAVRDIWLLRRRTLLTRARGDGVAYQDLLNRYRAMAKSLGFEGHIAMAEGM
jgi:hypothetical protein